MNIIGKYHLPLEYVGNYAFWIGRLNPDFIATNGRKIIVEIFGRYWHEKTKNLPYLRTEKGRIEYYQTFGWLCLIFWEEELKNELEVIDKICHAI